MARTLPVLSGTIKVNETRYRAQLVAGPFILGTVVGWKFTGWLEKKLITLNIGKPVPKALRVFGAVVIGYGTMALMVPSLEKWIEGK